MKIMGFIKANQEAIKKGLIYVGVAVAGAVAYAFATGNEEEVLELEECKAEEEIEMVEAETIEPTEEETVV